MRISQRTTPQRGFTLVELMIGIVIGMIVIAAATSIYLTTVRGSVNTIRHIKLNQELRAIMDVMVNDIRRAGYWENNVIGDIDNPLNNIPTPVDPTVTTQTDPDNPFTVRDAAIATAAGLPGPTDITILNGSTCIIYTYDATYRTGNTFAVDTTDYFGFQLFGSNIRMPTASPNTTADCTAGTWQIVNDDITISALTFSTFNSQCRNTETNVSWSINVDTATIPACDCTDLAICPAYVAPTSGDLLVETRQIAITIEGSHNSDANARIAFTEQVKLRNNRLVMAP